jgi:hypothetical protein
MMVILCQTEGIPRRQGQAPPLGTGSHVLRVAGCLGFFLMVALTLTNQTLDRFTRCRP